MHCLAAAGDVGAARHHLVSCEVLFRRELDRLPDSGVPLRRGPARRSRSLSGMKPGCRWPPTGCEEHEQQGRRAKHGDNDPRRRSRAGVAGVGPQDPRQVLASDREVNEAYPDEQRPQQSC